MIPTILPSFSRVIDLCKTKQYLLLQLLVLFTHSAWKVGGPIRCFVIYNLNVLYIAGLQRRHQGVLIPVQTTATSRRRKGVPRGRKPIPQGRPPKLSKVGKNNKELSMKKFKPRKPHNLSSNISKNTLNAQVH